jgi:hypothetical protein
VKATVDLLVLAVGVFIAYIVQEALPPMHDIHGAHIILIPMVFCYAAAVLPFPAMLAGAVFTGFVVDILNVHVVGGRIEIPAGASIFYFVTFGCIANGFRSAMKGGNILPFALLSGLGTSGFLLMQFALITWHRGGFVWEHAAGWRILAPGVMAALVAPLFHLTLSNLDRLVPDGSRKKKAIAR